MIDITYIIDDDPIVLAMGQKLIKTHQAFSDVITAQNGEQAISLIREIQEKQQKQPKLILLDLNMPVMDGWEFLDCLKEYRDIVDIDIYIFTSSINPADIERSKTYANVKGYISKPLTMEVLDNLAQKIA